MKLRETIKLRGDSTFRGQCPMESAEQATFVNRLRREFPDSFGRLVFHVKNEGKRTRAQYDKDFMDGLNTGAADIIIPGAITFVCELKRRDHTKSRISDQQQDFLEAAERAGAFAIVALGCDAAWEAFQEWRQLISALTAPH